LEVDIGKVGINEIRRILRRNKDSILWSNVIGSDFSFLKSGSTNLIFKIEPMVFYKHMTVQENAFLSVTYPLNDFLTSGTWPSFAMIDFERPSKSGEEFYDYVDGILDNLRQRNIKVASGHTGSYGNIDYGVAGTMALLGLRRPIFSFRRVDEDDSYYFIGSIGNELSFFKHRGDEGSHVIASELSVESYVKELIRIRAIVHYIHDVSEGGLMRALEEISDLVKSGFNVSSEDLLKVSAKGVEEYGAGLFSASSSGSLVVSVSSGGKEEFERVMHRKSVPIFKIGRRKRGITLDGKRASGRDGILDFLS
jgi:hydrogenase maturation factor